MTDINAEIKELTQEYYQAFEPVYEDFRVNAINEYKFELEPLPFTEFIESVQNKLIKCLIYLENNEPKAFLIYTLAISESIELNIIHSLHFENLAQRSCALVKRFLQEIKKERLRKVVCYPMLGKQRNIVGEISLMGFKFVGIAVLRFMLAEQASRRILNLSTPDELPEGYSIRSWHNDEMNDAVRVVQNAFSTSADALFDTRFASLDGTYDILNKIVTNIYAEFMPEASSVLYCNGKPIGYCFVNITGGKIVNIPIFAISKEHQSKGLAKYLLAESLHKIIAIADANELPISEINTNTETNNFPALKMYRNLGFKEDYNYPQSYLPTLSAAV